MKKLIILLGVVFIVSCNQSIHVNSSKEITTSIHKNALILDSHVDTPLNLTDPDFYLSNNYDSLNRYVKLDIPRMKEGGLDAVFFAVFVGQGERTEEGNQKAKERALEIFDSIHFSIERNDELVLALNSNEAREIEKSGNIALFIGMENGYPVGTDLSLVQGFYELGTRYITLCHTRNNDICDSSTDRDGLEYGGLSDFGVEVVKEMNRLGMIIDISHASDETFYDVLELSETPVIASHSNARAMQDVPRNLDDKMIKKLAKKGGVIQVCLVNSYLAELDPNPQRDSAMTVLREKYHGFDDLSDEERTAARKEWQGINDKFPPTLATLSDVADHIDHIVEIAGIDHVGFGSDFDGGGGVDGLYDVSELPNLTRELLRRGYSENEIQKFWSGNFLRVMKAVEDYAQGNL